MTVDIYEAKKVFLDNKDKMRSELYEKPEAAMRSVSTVAAAVLRDSVTDLMLKHSRQY